MSSNDLRTLRNRRESDVSTLDRDQQRPPVCSRSALVQTVAISTYPTSASVFYGVTLIDADGSEAEGSTATLATDGDGSFTAYNLGSAVPPVGTTLIASMVGGKWVFRYDG